VGVALVPRGEDVLGALGVGHGGGGGSAGVGGAGGRRAGDLGGGGDRWT